MVTENLLFQTLFQPIKLSGPRKEGRSFNKTWWFWTHYYSESHTSGALPYCAFFSESKREQKRTWTYTTSWQITLVGFLYLRSSQHEICFCHIYSMPQRVIWKVNLNRHEPRWTILPWNESVHSNNKPYSGLVSRRDFSNMHLRPQ